MSTISASTTSTTAFKVTSDTTGTLVFQTGASPTTAMSISSSQIISFTNPPTATGAGSVSTNTAYGSGALSGGSQTGVQTTAIGANAFAANTSGSYGVAVGYNALTANTTGLYNTAVGRAVLSTNTTGTDNTASGHVALSSNTTGSSNTAYSSQALISNTTASYNTAIGYQAGYSQTTGGAGGGYNLFLGYQTGYNCTGSVNTFVGIQSGYYVTTGTKNSILGNYNGNQGSLDIRTASNYIVLSDGDGNPRLYINNNGDTTISPGALYCAGSYNNTTASAANLNISAGNYLITRSTSALKYKQDIRDIEEIDINKFRAVRYKSKCDNDDQTKDHFGVIADEVAEAGIEELVTRNEAGEVEGFQYERLTVVLLKKLQVLEAKLTALENK